jgi:hypothetical protein
LIGRLLVLGTLTVSLGGLPAASSAVDDLGVRSAPGDGGRTIRVETTLDIRVLESVETEDGTVVVARGTVDSERRSCRRGRTVAFQDPDSWVVHGKGRSDRRGRWRVVFDDGGAGQSGWRVFVSSKEWVREKNGNRILCRPYF